VKELLKRLRPVWVELRENKLAVVGGVIVVTFVLLGILAPYLAPYDPLEINLREALKPPSAQHWMGTDNHGRDILSRVLFGARLSLYIGVTSVVVGMLIGVALGLLAGYYDRLQTIIMRSMDVILTFPGLIVALTVIAILGNGINNVVVAIAVSQIPQFARLVNGTVLTLREQLFVEAGIATGESDSSILFRYILPNAFAPIMIQASLLIPSSIMVAASLSFLGLGVQPPTPEWGAMINLGRQWMRTNPQVMLFPGFALMTVVLGFNLFGDGLRDALDPKLQQG